MSASERLRALDEAIAGSAAGYVLGVGDEKPSEWPPNIRLLTQLRDALPLLADVVEAAERAEKIEATSSYKSLASAPTEMVSPIRAALAALREHLGES